MSCQAEVNKIILTQGPFTGLFCLVVIMTYLASTSGL